ncbi:hypothetical protein BC567DRAFT_209226 [Phyllosticta citribraziliensis]
MRKMGWVSVGWMSLAKAIHALSLVTAARIKPADSEKHAIVYFFTARRVALEDMTDGRIHRHGRIYLFLSANGQRDNIPPSSLGKGPQRRPRSPFSDTSYSRLLPKLTFSASVGLRSLYACHHRPRRLQGYSEREGAAHSRRPYVFRPVEDAMTCELQELYDFPAWFSLLPWSQRDCPGYLPEHRQRRPSPTSPSSAQDAEISHVDQISAQNLELRTGVCVCVLPRRISAVAATPNEHKDSVERYQARHGTPPPMPVPAAPLKPYTNNNRHVLHLGWDALILVLILWRALSGNQGDPGAFMHTRSPPSPPPPVPFGEPFPTKCGERLRVDLMSFTTLPFLFLYIATGTVLLIPSPSLVSCPVGSERRIGRVSNLASNKPSAPKSLELKDSDNYSPNLAAPTTGNRLKGCSLNRQASTPWPPTPSTSSSKVSFESLNRAGALLRNETDSDHSMDDEVHVMTIHEWEDWYRQAKLITDQLSIDSEWATLAAQDFNTRNDGSTWADSQRPQTNDFILRAPLETSLTFDNCIGQRVLLYILHMDIFPDFGPMLGPPYDPLATRC